MTDNPFDPKFYPGYVPFDKKLPVPFYDPLSPADFCVVFNAVWAKYIRGALASLMYRDMYLGTDQDIDTAVQQAGNLLALFNDGSCVVASQYRIDPDDPCKIQVSTDGITWLPFFDATICFTPTDESQFLRKETSANYNVVTSPDHTLCLRLLADSHNAAQFESIGEIPLILQSYANVSGIHGHNLLLERPTPPADRQGLVGFRYFTFGAIDLINFDGAYIAPNIVDSLEGIDTDRRRGALYRVVESDTSEHFYAVVQRTPGTDEFRQLAFTDELPTQGLDGAGITAVELQEIVPTATPYATLSTPSTIQDQLLSLGINRGVSVASVQAVTLDPGTDADIESTINTDGDLELTFGIPRGDVGAAGAQGVQGPPGENGSLDDQPPTTGQKVIRMIVLAQDSALPFPLQAGMSIVAVDAKGMWGLNAIMGLAPLHIHDYQGFIDESSNQTGELVYSYIEGNEISGPYGISNLPLNANSEVLVVFGEADVSATPNRRFGYLQVDVLVQAAPGPWTHVFDFENDGMGNWISSGNGAWVEGEGIFVDFISDVDQCIIQVEFYPTFYSVVTITSAVASLYTESLYVPVVYLTKIASDGYDELEVSNSTPTSLFIEDAVIVSHQIDFTDGIVFSVNGINAGSPESPRMRMLSLTVSGIGPDPFL